MRTVVFPPVKIPSRRLQVGAVAERFPDGNGAIEWVPLGTSTVIETVPPPLAFKSVQGDDVRDAWHRASVERQIWLEDLHTAPKAAPQMPKDLTASPRYMYMRCNNAISARFAAQLASIGRREGFSMVVESRNLTEHGIPTDMLASVTELRIGDGRCNEWAEDDGNFDTMGGVSIPARIGSRLFMDNSIIADRKRRLHGLSIDFTSCGEVDISEQQRQKIALALSGSRPLRECFSHVEGGNILLGTLPSGERYGLVGRDSIALTQALLKRDSSQFITRRRAMLAIAKDYSLDVKNLFPVEQPGDFHIDMSLAVMGEGQVILNDSLRAAEFEIDCMMKDLERRRPLRPAPTAALDVIREYNHAKMDWRQLRAKRRNEALLIHARATERARYEALTYRDLLDAKKLSVYRIAGRFDSYFDKANFISGEGGTNPSGERFFVTQGGHPRAQAYIAAAYMHHIPTGLRRVYFLDARASAESSLNWSAGLGCRAKIHGTVPLSQALP